MDKIPVIVPIYNVDKYLKQCLDCIVNQSRVSKMLCKKGKFARMNWQF